MSVENSDSALRGVFGSTMSLSELSGDVPSKKTSASGYSRFGLNEHKPAHQMHTRVRRPSSSSSTRSMRKKGSPLVARILILFGFGIAHGWLMNYHLPQSSHVQLSENSKTTLLIISGLLTTFAGFLVSDSDTEPYIQWWASFVRGYGAVLGLLYLSRHLPARSVLATIVVNPSMWYIADATINGFLTASLLSMFGVIISCCIVPNLITGTDSWSQALLNLATTGSSYFGASLLAGNLGRGLSNFFD